MKKIDTSKWKEFLIGDLFDIHPTKAYKKINIELFEEDGMNPVIVNTGFNNGVGGYANLDCTEKAGTITFTDTAAKSTDSFFYQERDFIGYPHVQGMYAKTHEWTRNEGLFLNSVIKSILRGRYDFIRKMTRAEMLKLKVKLPAVIQADGTYIPDWAYMDEYMSEIVKESEVNLASLMKADNEKHEVNTSKWKEFTIGDLFDIHPTKAYKKINIELFEEDGTNPVVVNTGFNNGVGGYSNLDCTEKAGTITFTDTAAKSTDSFFYQEKDFIGYPHVQGMYAKTHEWTKNEGLFLNSVIKSILNGRYDFIRKMTRAEMLKLK